jgi:hypothetical protein
LAAYDAREEAEAHAKAEERASEAKAKAEERAVEAKEKAEAAAVEAEDAFARAFRAIDYCEKKHAGLKGPELEENLNINNAQTGLRIFGFVVLVAGMVASIPILVEPWREFFVKITG